MAFITSALSGGNADLLIEIEDSDADAELNVTGAATPVLYLVEVDCTENPGEDVYTRIYASAAPVVGTTDAEVLCWGKAGKVLTYRWRRGIAIGAAMSVATVTDPGATSGATSPTGKVKVRMQADAEA